MAVRDKARSDMYLCATKAPVGTKHPGTATERPPLAAATAPGCRRKATRPTTKRVSDEKNRRGRAVRRRVGTPSSRAQAVRSPGAPAQEAD